MTVQISTAQHSVTIPLAPGRAMLHDLCFWFALMLGPVVSALLAAMGQGFVAQWPAGRAYDLLWLVLLYPLVEEWLFRGWLQSRIWSLRQGRHRLLGISLANGITSLLFVAAHLLTLSWPWALAVGAPSLVFGWFRDRYHNMLPAVILHCAYNLAYFLFNGLPAGSP